MAKGCTMLTSSQRLERLSSRLNELKLWLVRDYQTLTDWTFDGQPLSSQQAWPERTGVHLLTHLEVTVPEGWRLESSYLDLNVGGESLLTLHYPEGRTERFGVNPHHEQFPLLGRTFSVELGSVARFEFGVPNYAPRLERTRLIYMDTALERLHRLLSLLHETAVNVGEHEVTPFLLGLAERALQRLRWPSYTDTYLARTVDQLGQTPIWERPEVAPHPPGLSDEERAQVEDVYEDLVAGLDKLKERYPKQGHLTLSGHAHLDLAWLWPVAETRRKGQRTMYSMLSLMKRYPEFRFNQSSAQLYDWLETDDPALFAQLREVAQSGQLEPLGAMWVEPDTSMPSGESLVRQLLYGQRAFERFGKTSEVCWLPDCFGFSPALPQLLQQAGVPYFFTTKINWNETDTFPHDLFWWEGIDGSRVLTHTFKNELRNEGYNGSLRPDAMLNTWRNYRGKVQHPESLFSVGWGDGGGGTTRGMLENARLLEHMPVVPEATFEHVSAFYERVQKSSETQSLPVWVGELYLELHRGTLTTQGRTKRLHRRAEQLLVAAETLSSMAYMLGEKAPSSLEPLWRDLLFSQFHDVLPGSSIREVYEETEVLLENVIAQASEVLERGVTSIAQSMSETGEQEGVLVINPSLQRRALRITLDKPVLGAQEVEGGHVLTGKREIASLEASVITQPGQPGMLSVSTSHLENDYLRVELGEDGVIERVFDKVYAREVLAGRGNQLWAYVDKPRNWDAWDVDENYREQGEEITHVERLEIVESGPHRAALRLTRRFRSSFITQEVRLWADSRRLDFHTTLKWHDRRWLLKALFPLNIRATEAHFECAYGLHKRPTHRNTSWDAARFEVAQHRFTYLSEPLYSAALLNNGKYGVHALSNELGLSLLRSPIYPDYAADEGVQRFSYALYSNAEADFFSGLLSETTDLNMPLIAQPAKVDEEVNWQAVEVSDLTLGLGALKVAEDTAELILRLYEPQGARGEAKFRLAEGWRIEEGLDLLEQSTGTPDFTLNPFQVRSYKVVRG